MIIFLLAVYLVLLFGLVKLKIVHLNLFWKISPLIVLLLLNLGLFLPMSWGAPQGPVIVVRNSVQIVPEVAGEVASVSANPNVALKAGDELFRIDPTPYASSVKALEAQLGFQKLRLSQMTQLQSNDSGRAFDVQQRQAEVDELAAKLEGAKWNLDKTIVRAPGDGYVTNVALRKGARVANLPLTPVMAFIDTSETLLGVSINQNNARYIQQGQPVELTFKFMPGKVYTGKVETVLEAISQGQVQASGLAATPTAFSAVPFAVRVTLDDTDFARQLPAGSVGDAAIFTEHVKPAHVIRRVILRQIAILNYILPF